MADADPADPDRRADPAVEVRAAFDAYEAALVANDVDALDAWFWDDPQVVRFGLAEQLYGPEAIAAWRAGAEPVPADRRITAVSVLVLADDVVAVDCEFRNGDRPGLGRQSQTWLRTAQGWRIARAHVSMNPT